MSKTLSQLITDTRLIIGQPDSANSPISDPQITVWLNDAYRRVATALRTLPVKERDYTPFSAAISLNKETVSIDIVRFKVQPANEFVELTMLTLEQFVQMFPDYENDDSGIPAYFVRTGTLTARIHPSPNSSNQGQTLRTQGLELPTELSSSTDEPSGIPPNTHDILGHWASHRCFQFLERMDDSVTQLTLFRGGLKDQKQISQDFSRKLKQWRFESSEQDDE